MNGMPWAASVPRAGDWMSSALAGLCVGGVGWYGGAGNVGFQYQLK